MAGDSPNGFRDVAAYTTLGPDSRCYLRQLLAPLHHDPFELADRILGHFGSLASIVDAQPIALRQCAREGETWAESLLVTRELLFASMHERVLRTKLAPDDPQFHRYLVFTMRGLREERLVAIMADASGDILCEETVAHGSQTSLSVTPRRIFTRALALDCHRIVLAHNHPSGSAEPSAMDIDHTRLLARQAQGLGISIDDHLVVGRNEVVSMRKRGLL